MVNLDLSKYDGKYAMHCPKKWMAKEFCDFLHANGRKWSSGRSYNGSTNTVKNNWDTYKDKTCYYFNRGQFGHFDSAVDRRDELHTLVILEFSEFYVDGPSELDRNSEDMDAFFSMLKEQC